MKFIYILSLIVALSFCNSNKSATIPNLDLKSVVKSVFDIPRDSTGRRIYLIELKMINKSDSTIEFLTQNCTPMGNLIFDSKDIIPVVNNCVGNKIGPVLLKPNQEFSLVFMITSKNSFPKFLKVGWIFITLENTGYIENYFNVLDKSSEKLENIIWSAPIELTCCGGYPYEVR